jgi:hypothetical protein
MVSIGGAVEKNTVLLGKCHEMQIGGDHHADDDTFRHLLQHDQVV